MDYFDLLRDKGPEGLVGTRIMLDGEEHEIVRLLAVGNSMIVYDLRNTRTGAEDQILKIPRSQPGTPEYERVIKAYDFASQMRPGLFAPTTTFTNVIGKLLGNNSTAIGSSVGAILSDALDAVSSGSYERAVELLNEALRIEPNNEFVLCNKASLLCLFGDYDEAIRICDGLLNKKQNTFSAFCVKGEALLQKQKGREAIECFLQAASISEDSSVPYLGIGRILIACGDLEKAAHSLSIACSIDPDDADSQKLLDQVLRQMDSRSE